jgi:hydroxymethylbilane synthase
LGGERDVREILARWRDEAAWSAVVAERSFLHTLEGGGEVPVGALALPHGGTLRLHGVILDVDGGPGCRGAVDLEGEGTERATSAGESLAESLLAAGGSALLARARGMASVPKA